MDSTRPVKITIGILKQDINNMTTESYMVDILHSEFVGLTHPISVQWDQNLESAMVRAT